MGGGEDGTYCQTQKASLAKKCSHATGMAIAPTILTRDKSLNTSTTCSLSLKNFQQLLLIPNSKEKKKKKR